MGDGEIKQLGPVLCVFFPFICSAGLSLSPPSLSLSPLFAFTSQSISDALISISLFCRSVLSSRRQATDVSVNGCRLSAWTCAVV